jgi:hypothetical protein
MSRPSDRELRAVYNDCDGVMVAAAERLGRPLNTVKSWYKVLGLRGKGRGGPSRLDPPRADLEAAYARFGGNLQSVAEHFGRSRTAVHSWLKAIGLQGKGRESQYDRTYPREIRHEITDGYVVAFSDCHWWEKEKSPAHQALLEVIKQIKPKVVIAAGDLLDGARISRHDPSGLDPVPTLDDELAVCQAHAAEIKRAAKGAVTYLTPGNHDSRFSAYIARKAPELSALDSSRLDHHLFGWKFCWSVRFGDELLVMHRFRGGQHAVFTNTIRAGISIATGHLHSQRVYPFSDSNGTRWGVDLGCLADPSGPQFTYTEASPLDWRSGFAVFQFKGGKMLPPQLVTTLDDGSVWMQANQQII